MAHCDSEWRASVRTRPSLVCRGWPERNPDATGCALGELQRERQLQVLRVHHVPMPEENGSQCGLGLGIPRLERSPYAGCHLALLVRQRGKQRHEGRAVDISCGQRLAEVVAASLLVLRLQA